MPRDIVASLACATAVAETAFEETEVIRLDHQRTRFQTNALMPRQIALMLLLAACHAAAETAQPQLNLRIIAEDTPPGGSVQVKIYADSPRLIAFGSLTMQFDQSVFGDITNVALFSPTGNVYGYAHVEGGRVSAQFSSGAKCDSGSGCIGQLSGLPILAISVLVRPGLPPGRSVALTADPSGRPIRPYDQPGWSWDDPSGNTYLVNVTPATFHVGGSLSVQAVTPGGGVLPEGATVQIDGTGLDPSTAANIDGVSIASTQFVSPRRIKLVLGGPTEMTGKCLHLANSAGERIDYFASMPSRPQELGSSGLHTMVPLPTYRSAYWGLPRSHLDSTMAILQNPTLSPVTVSFFYAAIGEPWIFKDLTIPPGGRDSIGSGVGVSAPTMYMVASAPIRIMLYYRDFITLAGPDVEVVIPPEPLTGLPMLSPYTTPLGWSWQTGTAAPAPSRVFIDSSDHSTDFTVSVSEGPRPWLAVNPSKATAPAFLTLTPNVSSLGPGIYTAKVKLTPAAFESLQPDPLLSQAFDVTLTVSASPLLSLAGVLWNPVFNTDVDSTVSKTLPVQSTGGPLPFTVSAITDSNGNWLAVNPAEATAPSSLTINANFANLPLGVYTGKVLINGPANTLTVPVTLIVSGQFTYQPPPLPTMLATIANAASQRPSSIAPGEIVSIFGTGLGKSPSMFTLDAFRKLPVIIGSTQVLINGKPAPLLYTSASQINAIIPFDVGESGTATIQVVSRGVNSESWGIPVVPVAPAIFTTDGGLGQAAMLNQDNSYNSSANPAPPGSTVQLFATGGGQTSPASETGTLAGPAGDTTLLPVTVTIGGIEAPVAYHGSAPGLVTGLLQINAIVPSGVKSGPDVPVSITVGGRQSPAGVTMAVQ